MCIRDRPPDLPWGRGAAAAARPLAQACRRLAHRRSAGAGLRQGVGQGARHSPCHHVCRRPCRSVEH
eukprot:14787668-Alexandrium_andersonii.AAC.1